MHLPELALLLGRQRASAAGVALLWNGSGSCLNATRTSLPYSFMTCLTVGSTRPQNGHWKSENSTIVTLASFGALDRRVLDRCAL